MRRVLVALSIVCISSTARASSTFPSVVERVTAAKVTCSTCHQAVDAGPWTDLGPFGAALRARGAVGKDDAALEKALGRMRDDKVDSDGDGARDLDELGWGGDPNVADLPPEVPEEPHYGFCTTNPGRQATWFPTVFLALLALRRRTH